MVAKPVATPAVAQAPTEPEFVYSPIGKRDPFRSPLDDLIVAHTSEGHCPLCRWSLDQLKLVAVVTGTGSPMAMVEDPNGVGHLVRQGTAMGRLGGRVSVIQRDQMVVTEKTHDPFGKVVQSRTTLQIERSHDQVDPSASASLLEE
ncbi:MAG: pilus assembly protein PilP [Deltaproteobacteria bacterium]